MRMEPPSCIAVTALLERIRERNVGQLSYGIRTVATEVWREAAGAACGAVRAVELHWLNGVVFTEVVFEQDFGPEVSFGVIERYWESLYESTPRIEAAVYAHFNLPATETSTWQTPLSTLVWDGSSSQRDSLTKMLVTDPNRANSPELISTGSAIVAASWDGVIVAVNEGIADNRQRVEFLVRLTCLEWAIIENIKTQLYSAMSEDGIWPRSRMRSTQDLIVACHTGMARCDPFYLAYDEGDIELIRTVERSWHLNEVKLMARQLLGDMSKIYAMQSERQQLDASLAEETRQKLLNLIVAWLGISGIAGTVAGVLSFIDYRNEQFGTFFRIVSLVLSTGLFTSWVVWKLTSTRPSVDD